jgi:NADH-quinone oxidoreductase subunit J
MSPSLLAALPTLAETLACPSFWGIVTGVIGLWLLVPSRIRFGSRIGGLSVAVAGGLLAADMPRFGPWLDQIVFWLLALVTLGGGVAMIASQSPVYSAICFAVSLLGTAGLFLFNGAEFVGVATVVVYAGAIVVTFLFVIMLAQPEGHSAYDRLTWGGLPKILGVVAAGLLVGIVTFMLARLKDAAEAPQSAEAIAAAHTHLSTPDGVLAEKHMANLGRHLLSEHLISIELAGTLLLVALVGAVAIALQGRTRAFQSNLTQQIEEAMR